MQRSRQATEATVAKEPGVEGRSVGTTCMLLQLTRREVLKFSVKENRPKKLNYSPPPSSPFCLLHPLLYPRLLRLLHSLYLRVLEIYSHGALFEGTADIEIPRTLDNSNVYYLPCDVSQCERTSRSRRAEGLTEGRSGQNRLPQQNGPLLNDTCNKNTVETAKRSDRESPNQIVLLTQLKN